jgi:hypothetical protein
MANVGSIATARGEQFTHAHVASLSRCNSGFYVLSGCDVHQAGTPGLSVVVDSGYISSGFATARKTVSGGTLTVATPDGSLPRMDVVYLDTNGTPSIYAGTPTAISPSTETDFKKMASPSPGASIPNGVILALVYVGAGVTEILNASILDIASYGGFVAEAPTGTTTSGLVPQWSSTQKTLTTGLTVGTAANNLVQLDGNAKLPAVDGSQLTGRVFEIDFPFGNGSDVIENYETRECSVPINCKIIRMDLWEVGLNAGSAQSAVYIHDLGADKGSAVLNLSIAAGNTYNTATGLSTPVSANKIIRADAGITTTAKHLVLRLVCEAT